MSTSLKTPIESFWNLEKTSLSNFSEKAEYLVFLKEQIKSLEAEEKALTAELAAAADAGDLELYSYETGIYDFEKVRMKLFTRAVWVYSPAVKQLQEWEKQSGAATEKSSSYYKFTATT
jgi:hypothetical protein